MRKFGAEIETLALQYLNAQGFQIICRNFHCRQGEIDLIGLWQEILIFVEVRFRKQNGYHIAEESITTNKKKKILHTAQYFLHLQPEFMNHSCRFDVIAVTMQGKDYDINWVQNAF